MIPWQLHHVNESVVVEKQRSLEPFLQLNGDCEFTHAGEPVDPDVISRVCEIAHGALE